MVYGDWFQPPTKLPLPSMRFGATTRTQQSTGRGFLNAFSPRSGCTTELASINRCESFDAGNV